MEENYRPKWMTDEKGRRLELDFYLADYQFAVEVQGAQHYEFVERFHGTYEGFLEMQDRDKSKAYLCRTLGITLVEVSSQSEIVDMIAELNKKLLANKYKIRDNSPDHRDLRPIQKELKRALNCQDHDAIRKVYNDAHVLYVHTPHWRQLSRTTRQGVRQIIRRCDDALLFLRANPQKPVIARTASNVKRRAKRRLHLEQLGGGHFLVYGGKESHRVMLKSGAYGCDCVAYVYHDVHCSHLERINIELGSHVDRYGSNK